MKTITTLLSLLIAVTITEAADFNGDGKPDYVLYNPTTHQTAIWYLNNNSYISGALGPTLPGGWSLIAEADFNGDGKPDYLLYSTITRQTAIWYMNNNVRIGAAYGPTAANGWIPLTVADFNGDGKPDMVLFNPATNQTVVWYLNNNVYVGGGYGPTIPPGYLLVSAAGDFNQDGKPDFLLYNTTTRRSAIWFLNNRTYVGGVDGPTLPASYSLDDLADFNHDGRPDYLLNADRVTALWYLNGNVLLGSAYGPTITPGWILPKLCVFSISPHSASYSAAAHSANIYVSTLQFGCAWTTTTTSPWIHITHGSSYVGSGYASYTVEANTSSMPRVGYITVAHVPFVVSQSGQTAPGPFGTWTGTGTWHYDCGGEGTAVPITMTLTAVPGYPFRFNGTFYMSNVPCPTYTCPNLFGYGYESGGFNEGSIDLNNPNSISALVVQIYDSCVNETLSGSGSFQALISGLSMTGTYYDAYNTGATVDFTLNKGN